MSQPAGKIWQNHEIEAIILDYITMLQDELEGKRIVKARHNERLQGITGRSRTSIEYKYQNISAVMEELGLPFINGYKPARNYQQALFMFVVKYIDYHNLERSLANVEGTTNASHEDLVYERAPGIEEDLQTKEPDICNFYKHNPAIRDEKLRKLGKAGEKFLLRAEKKPAEKEEERRPCFQGALDSRGRRRWGWL